MPAENILFPRPCYEGMISTSLEVIWEISVKIYQRTSIAQGERLDECITDMLLVCKKP